MIVVIVIKTVDLLREHLKFQCKTFLHLCHSAGLEINAPITPPVLATDVPRGPAWVVTTFLNVCFASMALVRRTVQLFKLRPFLYLVCSAISNMHDSFHTVFYLFINCNIFLFVFLKGDCVGINYLCALCRYVLKIHTLNM